MGVNLGLPCRHFYAVLRKPSTPVQFHLGLFNRRYAYIFTWCYGSWLIGLDRWLANPDLDIATTQAVTIGTKGKNQLTTTHTIPARLTPFHRCPSPPPATRTLPPKVIHHQAVTRFQDVLRHVHTEAELKSLNDDIDALM
jgi:hypothetical protein